MFTSLFRRAGALLVWLLVITPIRPLQAQTRSDALAQADRDFVQKSYKAALTGYERALKAGFVPPQRRDAVSYRIVVALGRTKQWDRALEQSLEFIRSRRGTVWEARGLYWIGRVYVAVPHSGFRVGPNMRRGDDVPTASGDDRPEWVDLEEQDTQNARDALETARVLFARHHAPDTVAEEIQLDFDLARLLRQDPHFAAWGAAQQWLPPSDPAWKIDPAGPYSPDWTVPQKLLYLYAQIPALDSRPQPHTSALALLGEALWLRQYQSEMSTQYAVKWVKGKPVVLPYPYQDQKPVAILRRLIHDFPSDSVCDQAWYALAAFLEQDGDYTEARAEYGRLIAQHPHGKWASDANAHLQEIARRRLALNVTGLQIAGKPPRISLFYRNVRSVHFQVYRVVLDRVVGLPGHLRNPDLDLSDFHAMFGDFRAAREQYGPLVAEWDKTTRDSGDYRPHWETLTLPMRTTGAYVVVASAPGVRAAAVVMLTDLVLAQKMHRDGALLFATDARTGAPVVGARVIAKEWYDQTLPGGATVQRSVGIRGVTDAQGLLTVPLRRRAGRSDFRVAALAVKGGGYALTDAQNANDNNDNGDNPGRFQVYSTTDRAVYRPLQAVHYRELVMERRSGAWKPVAGRTIHVQVFDPNGRRVHARLATSGEFGSIHGEFLLPADSPLGEYAVQCSVYKVEDSNAASGDNQFRVEEYRKPEVEVTVAPEAERVRRGQPTSVKVAATYYFGGPVPNAPVTYRVYRNTYAQSYRFPRPFDFLYNNSNGEDDTEYRNGEVVAHGTARTDAKGEAKVTFPTQADGARWQDADLSYTVEADVQDSSRRTVTGVGAVKSTRHDVAVFLDFPHGYATQGDRVNIDIRTLNPSDQPVSVTGTAKVFRQPETPDGKEALVHSEPLTTDAQGRAMLKWTADRASYFRIAFATRDTAGEEVEASLLLWVDGPELAQGRFHFDAVFLGVQNPYYEEGQAAKVLIVTSAPDCTVLLTWEANNEILDKWIVRVPGRSLEIRVPLTHRDVPNVYLSAIMVRNGEMHQATQELFVPPVRQLTTVRVQADKERYQPGEKATLRLAARDWRGRPLRTELAVSISDATLGYIQKDYAPDIRVYYYGDLRSQSVDADGSTGVAFTPMDEDRQRLRKFTLHQWHLPDGMGQLPDWPGRIIDNLITDPMLSLPHPYDGFSGVSWNSPDTQNTGFTPTGMVFDQGVVEHYLAKAPMPSPVFSPVDPIRVAGRSSISPLVMQGDSGPAGPQGDVGRKPAEPTLRSKFADTAFWTPAVVTDAQGNATVQVSWPDNLTRWRALAVGNTATAQVGTGETDVTTKKDLIVRLEAPRYFVEKDVMVVSADVHNYTSDAAHVKVSLDLGNDAIEIVSPDEQGENDTQQRSYAGAPGHEWHGLNLGKSGEPDCLFMNGNRDVRSTPVGSLLPATTIPFESHPTPSDELLPTQSDFWRCSPACRAYPNSARAIHGRATSDALVDVAQNGAKRSSFILHPSSFVFIDIPQNGEKRVDWTVRVRHEGTVRIRMTAQSAAASDATEMMFPVLVHGVEREIAHSGVIRTESRMEVPIDLPAARKPGASELVVQLNPSLGGVLLDALPYLNDYPYGCIEQTMSRFLPSVIVAKTLKDLGYPLEALRKRAEVREAQAKLGRGKLNVADSPYTYSGVKPGTDPVTLQRWEDPVFDSKVLTKMVRAGLARIGDYQHVDGGWGWWKDDATDPYMTAYVLYGLTMAQAAGYEVEQDRVQRGLDYLQHQFKTGDDLHLMAYEARVLAMAPDRRTAIRPLTTGRLYDHRERLSAYSKALLALALHDLGEKAKAEIVLRNLEDTAKVDEANGTANWDERDGGWWCWYNDSVETTATVLEAYLAIRPESPMAHMLVKWLVNNRKGDNWSTTRETAIAVYALSNYIRRNHELAPEYTLTVDLGGRVRRTYKVTHDNALFFDNRFVVPDALLQSGNQTLTLTKDGPGTCYYGAYTRYFSQEDLIPAAANEISVTRRYFRLLPETVSGQPEPVPMDLGRPNPFLTGRYELLDVGGEWIGAQDTSDGPRYTRVALEPDEAVASGDLLEVELQIESKNAYDYLLFEDVKPAGCEPVALRSGGVGDSLYANRELRDQKVAFFVSHLPQGTRTLTYRLRAEAPGRFHVLPTNAYAMYAPDVRALSAETLVAVHDEPPNPPHDLPSTTSP